jgi:hypothetical protein
VQIPPFLVEKNAALEIEDALPALVSRTLDAHQVAAVCARYRRIGICQLLGSGMPDGFFTWLAMSAQAFLHWLSGVPDAEKVGSLTRPWLDAVACGFGGLAQEIARCAAPAFTQGEEYEEDFLYLRVLMDRFSLGKDAAALAPLLDRWDALADGKDPRAPLARALVQGDAQLLRDAMPALLRELETESEAAFGPSALPDDAATAHVSIELLAVVQLAARAGFTLEEDLPLAPSIARRVRWAKPPGPDAWRKLPSYRSLG